MADGFTPKQNLTTALDVSVHCLRVDAVRSVVVWGALTKEILREKFNHFESLKGTIQQFAHVQSAPIPVPHS